MRCTLDANATATRPVCREAGGQVDQATGMAGPWANGLLPAERRRLPNAFSVAADSRPSHNAPQRQGVFCGASRQSAPILLLGNRVGTPSRSFGYIP